jgi:predicted DNA repair protein MutK
MGAVLSNLGNAVAGLAAGLVVVGVVTLWQRVRGQAASDQA